MTKQTRTKVPANTERVIINGEVKQVSDIDEVIEKLFRDRWCGDAVTESIDTMKEQLFKALSSQIAGYWSGHTAYHIAVDGGFLIDAKSGEQNDLQPLATCFINAIKIKR